MLANWPFDGFADKLTINKESVDEKMAFCLLIYALHVGEISKEQQDNVFNVIDVGNAVASGYPDRPWKYFL